MILKTIGALMLDGIMGMDNSKSDSYPSVQHILSSKVSFMSSHQTGCMSVLSPWTPPVGWNSSCPSDIPPSLELLISNLITSVKAPTIIATLGQIIVQAARPHSLLAPLQLDLPFRWTTTLY